MTLEGIRALVEVHPPGRGTVTRVPRQSVTREDAAVRDVDLLYRPMVCFVVAGAKTTTSGPVTGRVEAGRVFVSRLNLPVVATYHPPYRSVTLDVDERLLATVIAESPAGSAVSDQLPAGGAVTVADMDEGLVAALTRWVALAGEPHLIADLAPVLERELLVRILHGPLGAALRRAGTSGATAIMRDLTAHLTTHVDRPVTTTDLARRAGMSEATLFRQFRAATGMSPGQFQKITRLQAARRLIVGGTHTAAGAAVAVGYRSPTQFSRDYRRQYGTTPAADARSRRDPTAPR